MSVKGTTARWFKDRRGIELATLEAFKITSEGEGVVIPYPDGAIKHRATLEKVDGRHRMWFDPPAVYGQPAFLPPNFDASTRTKIVLEGETDTMATWQNAPADKQPGIMGMSGANAFGDKGWPDAKIEEYFGQSDRVFFVFDNEDPYKSPVAYDTVERGKALIRAKLGKKAKFVSLPQGPSDTCEFFQRYPGWDAFWEVIKAANVVRYNFPALDFKNKDMEYDWLVPDLLVKGDIAMLSGDPGVGKSWVGLDLAVAMMMERKWLGMTPAPGKVMVIDQENPKTTAFQRLAKLGLDDDVAEERLRYLWYAGVRLDELEAARKFYDDCANFEPNFLLIDSLSRVHFRNENSAEEMNPFFNGGIYPIARELGITVVLIHHLSRQGNSRGSTSIEAATDINLRMQHTDDTKSWQLLMPDKLRNVPPWGAAIHLRRVSDEDNGIVMLQTEEENTVV